MVAAGGGELEEAAGGEEVVCWAVVVVCWGVDWLSVVAGVWPCVVLDMLKAASGLTLWSCCLWWVCMSARRFSAIVHGSSAGPRIGQPGHESARNPGHTAP